GMAARAARLGARRFTIRSVGATLRASRLGAPGVSRRLRRARLRGAASPPRSLWCTRGGSDALGRWRRFTNRRTLLPAGDSSRRGLGWGPVIRDASRPHARAHGGVGPRRNPTWTAARGVGADIGAIPLDARAVTGVRRRSAPPPAGAGG